MSEKHHHRKPSISNARYNWVNSDLPFATKVRLAIKNELIKARTLKNCCGNDGEPGC